MTKLLKGVGIAAAVGAIGLSSVPAHAADFDAASTTAMVNTAIGNITPTLSAGIITVIGVALGVWVVFFLIGKLRKHTR
jgi:hypothetical protein